MKLCKSFLRCTAILALFAVALIALMTMAGATSTASFLAAAAALAASTYAIVVAARRWADDPLIDAYCRWADRGCGE